MDISKISPGTPEQFNVIVEIPEGSENKYEFDESSGFLRLAFAFRDGFKFITNYGFIPHASGGDGDFLDVMVVASHPIYPMTLVTCKPIAMIEILDRGEVDNKIIGVPLVDELAKRLDDLDDLSEEQLRGFEDFYRENAIQRNKITEIKGFHGKQRTMEEIKNSLIV